MAKPFTVRVATPADIPVLARHRVAMFAAMGTVPGEGPEARRLGEATERFLAPVMASGEWMAWLAEEGGVPLGSGAILLRRLAPRPGYEEMGREAYLLNFFTEPAARGRGVATAVVRAVLAWCAAAGIDRIELHASDAGRPVYERLGFAPQPSHMVFRPGSPAAGCGCGSTVPDPEPPPRRGG